MKSAAKTKLPLAVKLPPYFTALPNLVLELESAGADGVVLFNRFFHPASPFEIPGLSPPAGRHSAAELSVRLGWLAILYAQARCSLCPLRRRPQPRRPGQLHRLRRSLRPDRQPASHHYGPAYLKTLHQQLLQWMERHECPSIRQLQGCAAVVSCPDVSAFERAAYLHSLQAERPQPDGPGNAINSAPDSESYPANS